jgi:hypothetical protein
MDSTNWHLMLIYYRKFKKEMVQKITNPPLGTHRWERDQGCQIFLHTIIHQNGEIYTRLSQYNQITIKYTKWN